MASKMKRVTKNNMLRYIEMRIEYKKTRDRQLLKQINDFISVINKDRHYYSKIRSYNFSEEQIRECL